MTPIKSLARRLGANLREALWSLRYGDMWVSLFLAGGSMTWGALLLWPGPTLPSYHAYSWLEGVPDWLAGGPMLALGAWAFFARGTYHRRVVALALCTAWGALAIAITAGAAEHVAQTSAGPSAAPVHYLGWAVLAFLSALRATSTDVAQRDG